MRLNITILKIISTSCDITLNDLAILFYCNGHKLKYTYEYDYVYN